MRKTTNRSEIVGLCFGDLYVQSVKENKLDCVCGCGRMKMVTRKCLISGNVKSCGCRQKRVVGRLRRTHGKSQTAEYRIWKGMKNRCFNPNNSEFKNYGGRGIVVCDEWKNDFESFLAYIGPRPTSLHSVERRNVNKVYEPGNVYWMEMRKQARNIRRNVVNAEAVRAIRSAFERGERALSICKSTGLSRSCVEHIIHKRSWAEV